MVSVYIAHAQYSFYHFRMVVTLITFDLLAAAAFLELSNIPKADLIRDDTVFAVNGVDPLSRLHT